MDGDLGLDPGLEIWQGLLPVDPYWFEDEEDDEDFGIEEFRNRRGWKAVRKAVKIGRLS